MQKLKHAESTTDIKITIKAAQGNLQKLEFSSRPSLPAKAKQSVVRLEKQFLILNTTWKPFTRA